MKKSITLIAMMLVFTISIAQAQTPSFSPYVIYRIKPPTPLPEGLGFEFVEAGDFDGDGDMDIVGATTDTANDPTIRYTLFVWINNAGVLSNIPLQYSYGYGSEPGPATAITVADFNNDGKSEIIVAFGNARIKIFQIQSINIIEKLSLFTNHDNYPNIIASPDGVSVGDLDGDGRLDIAVSHWGSGWISVFYNENNTFSTNSFTKVNYEMASGGYDQVLVGRLDNDNYNSLIYMRGQGLENDVEILRIGSNRTIQQHKSLNLISPTEIPHGIALGNSDNSTNKKLAITSGGNMPNAWYSLSNGNMIQNTIQTFHSPETVRFGNLVGNNRDELVILHGGFQTLSVHNMQDYTVTYFDVPYASHYKPTAMTIRDFNGDGKPDIALANYLEGLVILYNTSTLLSVDNISKLTELSVYPNPTVGLVNIKTDQKIQTLELYDLSGRQVQKSENSSTIDLSSQPAGVYILKGKLKNGEYFSKQIIKK